MPRTRTLILLAMLVAAVSAAACRGTPTSSRPRLNDMQEVVSRTSAALASSEWLLSRDENSPPVVIAIQRVENRGSDVITTAERWWLMQAVASDVLTSGLARQRNIAMVIPLERLEEAQRRGRVDFVPDQAERQPTHAMNAELRSATRRTGDSTEELFECFYQITDLTTREVVWEASFSFTTSAMGRSFA